MRALAAAALALVLAGCHWHIPNIERKKDEGPWGAVRDRWSRHDELYDRFDTRAFADALFLAPEVRSARADRVAAWKSMTQAERSALASDEHVEAEAYDDFVVALFTPDKGENDLGDKRSPWRIALVLPDGEVLPDRVDELDPGASPRALYPFLGDFQVLYRVRFVRFTGRAALETMPFSLRIAGPSGKLEFRWGPHGATL
ncbi:hypothetical protein [Anaeromyxobacter paludicola]|uniref:Lipoprotein n=1 Tax=Anaeromyxobacter paludicola TaxID=2918171 RepID=A0ABN6N6R8_9BACT|nr:hypothetical protein [Anaeromyxobacter paludicola]BDG08861.1 hypothetical protein AMPC_19740 [Anaeromyxobacter paludicola]